MTDFVEFQKIPRLSRECVITEKIDGTNGCIFIEELGVRLDEPQVQSWPFTYAKETSGGTTFVFAGSRTRWIVPCKDNAGFALWVKEHGEELLGLGFGRHYGEWWGQGIQRAYDLKEKRFSLFNTSKWTDDSIRPACCHVVPILATGEFDTELVSICLNGLKDYGSSAAPGFMRPEGVVIYHVAGNLYFKKTIEKDESPKGINA